MAFLDFLGKDIGGMTGAVNDPGGLGVHAARGATGIKWGDLLTQAAQMKSQQQPSPFASPLVSQFPGSQGPGQPLQPTRLPAPQLQGPEKRDDTGDIMSLLKIFGPMFGIPVG